MNRTFVSLFLVYAIALLVPLSATATTPETVTVGNPGNAPDATGYGGVAYGYRIGKYEVTNSQYAEFLNAKAQSDPLDLYQPLMGSADRGGIARFGSSGDFTYEVKPDMGQRPAIYVSWYQAIRFANWQHNGQDDGETESGAYTLTGAAPTPTNAASITRNPGATWFLPTLDEWYKAAYHQPAAQGGDGDDYWLYATRTNDPPYSDQPPGSDAPTQSRTANFFRDDTNANNYDDGFAVTGSPDYDGGSVIYLTDVGAYAQSASFYGTFDQLGSVLEWNERIIGSARGLRGGAWTTSNLFLLSAPGALDQDALFQADTAGFRVARAAMPGDVNFDGVVNIFDVNLVSAHWGEAGPTGDGNGDMTVNIFDVNLISANWTPTGGGAVPVPEPDAAVLALLATIGLIACRWPRRRQD